MAIAQDGERKKQKRERLLQRRPVPLQAIPSKHDALEVSVCDEPARKSEKRKRSKVDGPESVINNHVMDRAKEVQSSLPPEFPSLVKPMVKSHVTGGFWLGLPRQFCILHLPKEDTMITLEDESREEHVTKYLSVKNGLSGGWRGFSIAHSLVEGDVLIFQLVEPTKFKVYIVRSNSFGEVDGALGLLELDPTLKRICSEDDSRSVEEMDDDKYWEPLAIENGRNSDEDIDSELLEGIRFSESAVEFQDVKSIEDFTIVVDGLVIDSELSKHIRQKYYDLCSSQNSFLHDKLIEGLNCKLAAGIISETVNIADAIRASSFTTPAGDFAVWEKTLKAFADLGMKVGSLLARLDQLTSLVDRSKRIENARKERACAEREVAGLEAKIMEVRDTISKLDAEIVNLDKGDDEVLELNFHELTRAPW